MVNFIQSFDTNLYPKLTKFHKLLTLLTPPRDSWKHPLISPRKGIQLDSCFLIKSWATSLPCLSMGRPVQDSGVQGPVRVRSAQASGLSRKESNFTFFEFTLLAEALNFISHLCSENNPASLL